MQKLFLNGVDYSEPIVDYNTRQCETCGSFDVRLYVFSFAEHGTSGLNLQLRCNQCPHITYYGNLPEVKDLT